MKQLLIIRHAKSSWDFSTLSDFDRPLNQRGHKDAPLMAKRLIDKQIQIDAFVSSTANRAFSTATYFAEAYGKTAATIIQVPALYHASPSTFTEVIQTIDASYNSVALFSHNPGITTFVNQLTYVRIDDMPTCGIYAIQFNSDWKDFEMADKYFMFLDYPKNQ